MDIKNIKRFLALSEKQSFSKASEFLAISQPSLTREIQKMEDEIGQKLFVRLPTGVGLTPTGEIYRQSFQKILNILEQAKTSSHTLNTEVSGSLKIAVHPVLAQSIAPLLEKHIIKEKGLNIDYVFTGSRNAISEVSDFRVDFAIVASTFRHKDIKRIKLWTEQIELFSCTSKTTDTILVNRNMINAEKILKKFKKTRVRWVDDYGVLMKILEQNDCMGLLPNTIIPKSSPLKSIQSFAPVFEISLIFRTDLQKTAAHRWLIDKLKYESQSLGGPPPPSHS